MNFWQICPNLATGKYIVRPANTVCVITLQDWVFRISNQGRGVWGKRFWGTVGSWGKAPIMVSGWWRL